MRVGVRAEQKGGRGNCSQYVTYGRRIHKKKKEKKQQNTIQKQSHFPLLVIVRSFGRHKAAYKLMVT